MILVDTGPLVALIVRTDSHREKVERAHAGIREPMLTTAACITEALPLLYRAGGWHAQEAFWAMARGGALEVRQEPSNAALRAADYMERYRDLPCDYADASLLVAAEETGIKRVFTIDPHFRAYRLQNRESLETVP